MKSNYGWVNAPDQVEKHTEEMGPEIIFGTSPLRGSYQRLIDSGSLGVFPHLAEKVVYGRFLDSFTQNRGTCVGQGTARAIQDSTFDTIRQRGLIARFTEIAVAPIYAGSRSIIGKNRLGGSDGAVGAWAARFVREYKVVARGKYGQYDLSKRNGDEGYAVSWRQVPKEVLDAGEGQIIAYRCKTIEDMLDAAAARFCMAFCSTLTYGNKDSNGVSKMNSPANHCTEALGVAIGLDGNPLIGGQQSWGNSRPSGPNTLKYRGGTVELRPGMCFVPAYEYAKALRSGECWAFQYLDGFRPKE